MRVLELFVRNLLLLAVIVLASACGNLRQWPSQLISTSNLSDSNKSDLVAVLEDWNKKSDKKIIEPSGKKDKGYNISIKITDFEAQGYSSRAGLASVYYDQCIVELSPKLFTEDMKGYLESVVGHEIGHCAGLRHVEDTEDLMYASTQPFASYSDAAITKFISSLFSSIGKL
jgi:hypothetical protein